MRWDIAVPAVVLAAGVPSCSVHGAFARAARDGAGGGLGEGTAVAVAVGLCLVGLAVTKAVRGAQDRAQLARLDSLVSQAMLTAMAASPRAPGPPPGALSPAPGPARPDPAALLRAGPGGTSRPASRGGVFAGIIATEVTPARRTPRVVERARVRFEAGLGATNAAHQSPGRIEDAARTRGLLQPSHDPALVVEPPPGLTPAEGGAVLHQAVGTDQVAAAWLHLDGLGAIRFERDHHLLTLARGPAPVLDPQVAGDVHEALDGDEVVTLGHDDEGVARVSRRMADRLRAFLRSHEATWGPVPFTSDIGAPAVGGLLSAGLALFVARSAEVAADEGVVIPLAIVAPLLGVALGVLFGGRTLRLGTPAGFAVWCRLEAFRRYLTSGPGAVERAMAAGRLGEYTAWAVGLGVGRRWAEAVAEVRPSVPDAVRLRARGAARLSRELPTIAAAAPA